MRRSRPVQITRSEKNMDLARWLSDNVTVEEIDGREWLCECPMCHRMKLAVNVERKAWQCWVCGFTGWQPVKLVEAVLKCDIRQAMEAVHRATGPVQFDNKVRGLGERREVVTAFPAAPLPPRTVPLIGTLAERYAHFRGISAANQAAFGLSAILGDGTGSKADQLLTGRLLFPIWDLRGVLVYWVARATMCETPKTLNLPEAKKHEEWGLPQVPDCAERSDVVLGIHLVKPGSRVIVVEGPLDSAVCGPGFVATLGASMSKAQAALIARSGAASAVILYDPDKAGRKGAKAALPLLGSYIPTKIAECPPDTDPGKLGRDESLSICDNTKIVAYIPPLR